MFKPYNKVMNLSNKNRKTKYIHIQTNKAMQGISFL